jgi:hypothetical protein
MNVDLTGTGLALARSETLPGCAGAAMVSAQLCSIVALPHRRTRAPACGGAASSIDPGGPPTAR